MKTKKSKEYQGGYVPIEEGLLHLIIGEYKNKKSGYKNLVRVFSAICEKKAVKNEKVDIYRIINCKSKEKGARRLSKKLIDENLNKLKKLIDTPIKPSLKRKRPVARKVLRQIAQGLISPSEAIVLLYYASKRITQVNNMKRLNQDERYARFKYADLKEHTGLEKSRIGEAVTKLKEKGLLHVVEVHQSNVNTYGLCFTDGWIISLYRVMAECVKKVVSVVKNKVNKTATAVKEKSNAICNKTAMLKKKNIKTLNKKIKNSNFEKKETWNETLDRLKKKCKLIEGEVIPQTA